MLSPLLGCTLGRFLLDAVTDEELWARSYRDNRLEEESSFKEEGSEEERNQILKEQHFFWDVTFSSPPASTPKEVLLTVSDFAVM